MTFIRYALLFFILMILAVLELIAATIGEAAHQVRRAIDLVIKEIKK